MFSENECKPCALAAETEDSALRLLDDALELVVTVLATSDSTCRNEPVEPWNDPLVPLALRRDVVTLAGKLRRRILAYVTTVARVRQDRQLRLPFEDDEEIHF